ncbi:MAG: hypothetical protein R3181_13670, partial [Rubricoccaceae bacterium]|nr:hypothetical protein [Rubricoccaceae bacterium]
TGLLPIAACADPPAPPPEEGDDEAFALLTRLDVSAIAEAYSRLDRYAYTAEVRLSAHDGAGARAASRTVERHPTDDGIAERLVSSEGDEAMAQGWDATVRLVDPLPALLPDEPAFLSARSREDYRYRLADTLLGGARHRVVEAVLRPEAGGEQVIRRARFLLAPRTDRILGAEVVRRSASVLYDETAEASVRLRPGPGGAFVLDSAVVETTVDVPGASPRRLRLAQRVRDVRPHP